jgi:hypothetical protein
MYDSTRDFDSAFEGDLDLPPTLDEDAINRMRFVAKVLDDGMEIPGTDFRIGLDPILGVLPAAGDAVSAGISLYIVVESARLGVSYSTLLRMIANIGIDFAIGSVPVVGVLFDALWKANVRNFEMALEELIDAAEGTAFDDDSDNTVTIDVE